MAMIRDVSRDPPISLGDSEDDRIEKAIQDYFGSDNDSDVDMEIADAAGLSAKAKGKQKERQVPLATNIEHSLTTLQCTRWRTSIKETPERLDAEVDYKEI